MPKLNPIFRGILYVSMLVFGALAITNVFFECFSFHIGIVIYIFAAVNAVMGITSHSAWFGSLAAYYILLSVMRIKAVNQERLLAKIGDKKEKYKSEVKTYRNNSILFVFLAVILIGMIILLENAQGGKSLSGIYDLCSSNVCFL